mgnify:CR=1 FL=1
MLLSTARGPGTRGDLGLSGCRRPGDAPTPRARRRARPPPRLPYQNGRRRVGEHVHPSPRAERGWTSTCPCAPRVRAHKFLWRKGFLRFHVLSHSVSLPVERMRDPRLSESRRPCIRAAPKSSHEPERYHSRQYYSILLCFNLGRACANRSRIQLEISARLMKIGARPAVDCRVMSGSFVVIRLVHRRGSAARVGGSSGTRGRPTRVGRDVRLRARGIRFAATKLVEHPILLSQLQELRPARLTLRARPKSSSDIAPRQPGGAAPGATDSLNGEYIV